ncbi:unknown [Oscillibacter sp. CAG:155]|nr:unknown [Oscillibacter sp. CAG:155]
MTNRQFLILLGICLIGCLFFGLKLLGTMLRAYY